MILILSSPDDVHAQRVIEHLDDRGAESFLLDLSSYPRQGQLSVRYEPFTANLDFDDGRSLPLNDCGAVWWRRPQPFQIDPSLTNRRHVSFCLNETNEAIAGLWEALDARWVNDPKHDLSASRKVAQLKAAAELGLQIPATCLGNSPEAARKFIAQHGPGRSIYKPFSATEADWRETRLFREQEMALLDKVKFAPLIIQECIEAVADLRITIVGDAIFPAAIYTNPGSYSVDFRMDIQRARIEPVTLPMGVEQKLLRLMKRLNIVYGAVDMRLTPSGEYVFLEVNPAGQWLFVEEATHQPISRTLAETLCTFDKKTRAGAHQRRWLEAEVG